MWQGSMLGKRYQCLTFVPAGPTMRETMYRLLIVDDEDDIRRGLAEFFPWSEIGFEVAGTAENGKQALEMVMAGGVDAVFSDIRMPLMSGIELAKALSEAGLPVPVVFLSAYRDFSYARKALQYGVRDYVLKPTDYADIRSVFTKLRRELDSGADRAAGAPAAGADPVVTAIVRYVERDCAHASLKGAARTVGLNAQYVSRIFHERTGEQFHTFLARTRMERAARLLRDGRYRAYEVSELVGYSNQKNFTRAFKQHFGAAPLAYRRQGKLPDVTPESREKPW
jgi:two-component system, response regulator YesN